MPESTESHDNSVRILEMRLFEEVGNQLKQMTLAVQSLTAETRDVRERVIRIEAQNQPEKLAVVEANIAELYRKANAMEQARQDAAAAQAAAYGEYKLANEKRMTRLEIIVAPITVGGSALAAAVVGALVAHFIGK